MDMVEKVAEAIWSAHTGQSDFAVDTYDHDEKERDWWRSVARAAIQAMRETPEMDRLRRLAAEYTALDEDDFNQAVGSPPTAASDIVLAEVKELAAFVHSTLDAALTPSRSSS